MRNSFINNTILATAFIAALLTMPVYAADSALDTSFSGDGYLHTDFGLDDTELTFSVLVQPDGKILTIGYTRGIKQQEGDVVPYLNAALTRYLPSGELDTTFGKNGKLALSFNESGLTVSPTNAMALLPDGKIIIAGALTHDSIIKKETWGETRILIARLNPDGSLDTGFSENGFATHTIPGNKPLVRDIQIQPNGKYLLAGTSFSGSRQIRNIVVARLKTNGELDTTFNEKGYLVTSIGSSGRGHSVIDLALQSDGEILVSGGYRPSVTAFDRKSFILNVLPDGNLDTSFGTNGVVTFDLDSGTTEDIRKLLTGPDNSLFAIGSVCCSSDKHPFVIKMDRNGNPITDFGDNGIKALTELSPAQALTGVLLPDGKLLVAGSTRPDITQMPFVARLNANGELDSSFNTTGYKLYSSIIPEAGYARFLTSHKVPTGDIVFAGVYQVNENMKPDILVAKANGQNYDLQVQDFSFANQTNADLNALVTSGIITIGGIATDTAVSVAVQNGEYKINNTAWTTRPGYVFAGDQIAVRHTSANGNGAETQTTLTVGGLFSTTNKDIQLGQAKSATFTSTTKPNPNNDNTDNQPTPDNTPVSGGGGGSLSLITVIALLGALWYRKFFSRFSCEKDIDLLTDNR